jgi:LysR family transcriptional regulator, low CO2-responsive transcriptional regulator
VAITVTQLNTFLAVIRGGSVTAAADQLMVTQPSVSSAIAALGRELGCELFERSGRGVRLTEAGEAFVPYATDVIGLLQAGRQSAREASEAASRRLRIIAVTTAAESFVPPLMSAFSQRHPAIELTLDVDNRSAVLDRILSHGADVAVLGTPPAEERLAAEPMAPNEIVCIAAPEDPATGRARVRVAELADRPWLLREPGSGTRSLNESLLGERGIAPRTLTLGSNGAIKQAARSGLGVSLISRTAVEDELRSGQLGEIRLLDGPPERTWFVVHSAVGPTRDVVRSFLTFVADRRELAPRAS